MFLAKQIKLFSLLETCKKTRIFHLTEYCCSDRILNRCTLTHFHPAFDSSETRFNLLLNEIYHLDDFESSLENIIMNSIYSIRRELVFQNTGFFCIILEGRLHCAYCLIFLRVANM